MDYLDKPDPQTFIAHHGIKGQKWGVRRFQNEDGSLTEAGRKRYDVDIERAKAKVKEAKENARKAGVAYNKATLGGTVYNAKAEADLRKAKLTTDWAKRKLASEKVKDHLNKQNGKKSERRLTLEKKYQEKGMSEEEAAIAAYKRVRTEKIIAATAGLTVAAATAYIAYKQYDKSADRIIKAGTELQNISSNSNKGVTDAFYFSMTKGDNTKYRGLYGQQIMNTGRDVYETKIGVKSAMKVASEKSAVRALSDLVDKDSDYAKTLKSHLESSVGRYGNEKQAKVISEGLKSLRKGKIDSKVYNALNLTLVDHDLPTSSKVNRGFYDKLKSMGYDAIMDVNDKKFSGYKSSKPMIAFNGESKATVNRIRAVGAEEISKAAKKGMLDVVVKSLAPSAAGYAGAGALVVAGKKAIDAKNHDKVVQEYRRRHPDTKLSYTQILDNYYNS